MWDSLQGKAPDTEQCFGEVHNFQRNVHGITALGLCFVFEIFFCPVRNLVCQPSQTISGFSNKLLNILMSLAAYCCPLAKPYCPNYSQYNNKQLCIGGGLSHRSVRLSQITFMSSFKARFLTAMVWPLYLFCSPVSLTLTQLEAGRLTKLKVCPSRKNLPISGQELLH